MARCMFNASCTCRFCVAATASRKVAAQKAKARAKKDARVDQVFIAGDYSKYLLQIHGVKP